MAFNEARREKANRASMKVEFKYKIFMEFNIPGIQRSVIPVRILKIVKKCNFSNNDCSVFVVNCLVTKSIRDLLEKNKNDVTVGLKIVRTEKAAEDEEGTNKENQKEALELSKNIYCTNEEFIPFFNNQVFNTEDFEEPDFSAKEYAENDDKVDNNDQGTGILYDIKITLLPLDFIRSRKITIRKILGGDTNKKIKVADALMNLVFHTTGTISNPPLVESFDKVLIDYLDNQMDYNDIKIFPNNIALAIRGLQVKYGMYQHGLIFYYDSKVLYILKKYSLTHETLEEEDEYFTLLVVPPKGMQDSGQSETTIRDDNKNGLVFVTSNKLEKEDNTVRISEAIGDYTLYSNSTLAANSIKYTEGNNAEWQDPYLGLKRVSGTHSKTGDKLRVLYDSLNNPFNASSFLLDTEMNKIYSIVVNNIDVDLIKPNKYVVFNYFDKELSGDVSGKHLIINAVINFTIDKSAVEDTLPDFSASVMLRTVHSRTYNEFSNNNKDFTSSASTKSPTGGYNKFSELSKKIMRFFNNETDINEIVENDISFATALERFDEVPKDALIINNSSRYIVHSQLDNKPTGNPTEDKKIAIRTCNLTSAAMAFEYSGFKLPNKLKEQQKNYQLEDYFYNEMIKPNGKAAQFFNDNYKGKLGAYYTIKTSMELSDCREIFFKDLFKNYNIGFKTDNLSLNDLVYGLVIDKRSYLISGKFPCRLADGSFGEIGHIVCLCGVITNQQDIRKIEDPTEVDLKEIVRFIIDDPYGNPLTNYDSKDGDNIELPMEVFVNWVRTRGSVRKYCQYFVNL